MSSDLQLTLAYSYSAGQLFPVAAGSLPCSQKPSQMFALVSLHIPAAEKSSAAQRRLWPTPFVFCLGPYEGGAQCTHSNAAVLQREEPLATNAKWSKPMRSSTHLVLRSVRALRAPLHDLHGASNCSPHFHTLTATRQLALSRALRSSPVLVLPHHGRPLGAPRWREWRFVFENTDEANFSLIFMAIVLL
jgi:hypothetical protein